MHTEAAHLSLNLYISSILNINGTNLSLNLFFMHMAPGRWLGKKMNTLLQTFNVQKYSILLHKYL